jgi:hypothetical protein
LNPPGENLKFYEFVVFVAIKNEMHASHGFVSWTGEIADYLPANNQHVKCLHTTILDFFKDKS